MGSGNKKATQNKQDYNQARGENLYKNSQDFLGAQANQFQGDYGRALESDASMRGAAFSGFQDFANTGGFSPQDLASMRARAIAPTRAVYANAQRDIGRRQAMGGTSAGNRTLMARMAREQGQGMSDASTNAEAGIAQLRQQGRLAGLSGISQLYGTTPGQTAMAGRQVLQNSQQGIDVLQGENQRMQGIQNAQVANKGGGSGVDWLGIGGKAADVLTGLFKKNKKKNGEEAGKTNQPTGSGTDAAGQEDLLRQQEECEIQGGYWYGPSGGCGNKM